jgi:hypothetical protein
VPRASGRGLFGEPVAGGGDDDALHVVCDELHGFADVVAVARGSADGEDGHW